MARLGIVPTSGIRLALHGAAAGALLGGLYGAAIGVVPAFVANGYGLGLVPIGLAAGASVGGLFGLTAGLVLGLAIGARLRHAPHPAAGDQERARGVPLATAAGFGLFSGLVPGAALVLSNALLEASDLLFFVVLPGLIAAVAGWWIGVRFLDWYELEWDASAPPPGGPAATGG